MHGSYNIKISMELKKLVCYNLISVQEVQIYKFTKYYFPFRFTAINSGHWIYTLQYEIFRKKSRKQSSLPRRKFNQVRTET
jgi:hypothetical protein